MYKLQNTIYISSSNTLSLSPKLAINAFLLNLGTRITPIHLRHNELYFCFMMSFHHLIGIHRTSNCETSQRELVGEWIEFPLSYPLMIFSVFLLWENMGLRLKHSLNLCTIFYICLQFVVYVIP